MNRQPNRPLNLYQRQRLREEEDSHAINNELVTSLLENDLNYANSLFLTESLQLRMALRDSTSKLTTVGGRTPNVGMIDLTLPAETIDLTSDHILSPEQQSEIASLKSEIDYLQSTTSKIVAEKLERMKEILESDSRLAVALEDALGFETRKETLDREFALVLGRVDAQGREDIDIVARGGVERVLGREKVGSIMRAPPPRAGPLRTQAVVNKRPLEAPGGQVDNQPPRKKAFIHPSRASNVPQNTPMATRSQKRPLETLEEEVIIHPPKKIFVHPSRANLVAQVNPLRQNAVASGSGSNQPAVSTLSLSQRMGIRQGDTPEGIKSPPPSAVVVPVPTSTLTAPVARPSIFHRHHDEAAEAMRIAQARLDNARLTKLSTWNNPAGPYGSSNSSSAEGIKSSSNFSSVPLDPRRVSASPSTSSRVPSNNVARPPALPNPQLPIITPVPTSKCNICFDAFYLSSNPFKSALLSSTAGPYGLSIGRKEDKHQYCSDCLRTYIQGKLLGDGKAFPMKCPESQQCSTELTISDAALIFGQTNLEAWHYKQLLDSSAPLFCPNKRCSARVVRHDDQSEVKAECPACTQLMCVDCEVRWHKGLTCAQFQSLPIDQRDPEDRALLALAKKERWARCPDCKVVIELTDGCFHITCSCGGEFCYLCNFKWDPIDKRCANPKRPACVLWEEDRLIAVRRQNQQQRPNQQQPDQQRPNQQQLQQDRDRDRDRQRQYAQQQAQYQEEVRQAQEIDRLRRESVSWMTNRVTGHSFTDVFLQTLRCGYCNFQGDNIDQLQHHLLYESDHGVHMCCGKFFREQGHLQQRINSARGREHNH